MLRLYSHLWHDGAYSYANKGDKPSILEFLRAPKTGPWFACIADSGQKHLLPYTPINPARSRRHLESPGSGIGCVWALLVVSVGAATVGRSGSGDTTRYSKHLFTIARYAQRCYSVVAGTTRRKRRRTRC